MIKIIPSCLSMMKIIHVRLSKSEEWMRMLVFLKSGGDGNGTNFEVGVNHLAGRRVRKLAGWVSVVTEFRKYLLTTQGK